MHIFQSTSWQYVVLCVDIVMHSATKFIAGHSDLMAGILAVKGERSVLWVIFVTNDHADSCQ